MHADNGPALLIAAPLRWLGGGEREPAEQGERATYAVAGLIVLITAALTTLVAAVAAVDSTHWPLLAVVAAALLCGALAGALSRAIAVARGRRSLASNAAIALAIGAVVAELAGLAVFAGSIDRRVDQLAARDADSAPAVVLASADLLRSQQGRDALDSTVEQARTRRDDALVVARCEYHPTPACPQTLITGVPGVGPESRTAKELLADAQQELRGAVAAREQQASALDANIATAEQARTHARRHAVATTDRGLGVRWAALNDYTRGHPGVLLLRLVLVGVCTLLILLPRIITSWRGETFQERHAAARAEVDRVELKADTAVAIKRVEVRAAAETLWAEQQLASTRFAVAAQTEIDAVRQRRRIAETVGEPAAIAAPRSGEADADVEYLPIAIEAAAAAAELHAGGPAAQLPATVDRLPATADTGAHAAAPIPFIPDIARTAARWIRPLVPSVVARAIDTTIGPMRTIQQVFEEVEEITFTLKRTLKVNVSSVQQVEDPVDNPSQPQTQWSSSPLDGEWPLPPPSPLPQLRLESGYESPPVKSRDSPGELGQPDGPRALPPG
ncbi:MAG: DUF4407 domain-containing protein [Mycobacterium sp.]